MIGDFGDEHYAKYFYCPKVNRAERHIGMTDEGKKVPNRPADGKRAPQFKRLNGDTYTEIDPFEDKRPQMFRSLSPRSPKDIADKGFGEAGYEDRAKPYTYTYDDDVKGGSAGFQGMQQLKSREEGYTGSR